MSDEKKDLTIELKEREIVALELNAIKDREWLPSPLAAIYINQSHFTMNQIGRDQEIPNMTRKRERYFRRTDLDAWMAGKTY